MKINKEELFFGAEKYFRHCPAQYKKEYARAIMELRGRYERDKFFDYLRLVVATPMSMLLVLYAHLACKRAKVESYLAQDKYGEFINSAYETLGLDNLRELSIYLTSDDCMAKVMLDSSGLREELVDSMVGNMAVVGVGIFAFCALTPILQTKYCEYKFNKIHDKVKAEVLGESNNKQINNSAQMGKGE